MPKKSLSPTTKPKVNPEVYQLFNQRKGRDGTKRGWDTLNWYKNLPDDYKSRVHQQSGYSKGAIAKWNKTIYNRKFDKKKPTWRYRPIAEDDLMSGITNEFGKGRTMMHTISPDQFISLASPAGSLLNKEHVAKIKKRILGGKSYSTPRLWMDPYESKTMKPNQKEWFSVRSHEGRHRAHAAKELGIKEMPVFMGTQETGRRDNPLSKTQLSMLRKFNVESQDDADNRLYEDRNNGKSRPKPRGLGATKKKIQTDIIIVPIDPVTFQPDKKSTFYSVWQFFDDDTKVHSYCNGKQGLGASADFEAKHPRGPDGEFIKGSGSTDVEANKRANKANWRDDHRNDKHAEIKERFKLPPRKLTSKLHGPSWLSRLKKETQYGGRNEVFYIPHDSKRPWEPQISVEV